MINGKTVLEMETTVIDGELIWIDVRFTDGTALHIDTAGDSTDMFLLENGSSKHIKPEDL